MAHQLLFHLWVWLRRLDLVFNFVHEKRTAKITVGFCVHFLYVKLDYTLSCFDSFPLIMAHQLWLLRLDLVFSFVHEKRTAKITVGFWVHCLVFKVTIGTPMLTKNGTPRR